MTDITKKLKNVWTEYKNTQKENKELALEYYKENIEGKSFKQRLKNSFKIYSPELSINFFISASLLSVLL